MLILQLYMLTKTKAFVLHTTKFGDSRLLITMFCREYGMMTFSCSVGVRGKGLRKSNYFQPLSFLEVEFDRKPLSEIQRIREVRIDKPAMSIPFDSYKLSISLFLAEFLHYALAGEQQNESLYDYIEQSIEWLDSAGEGFSNFHIVFMVRLTQFIGFFPNVESYSPGAWFDMAEGNFSALPPDQPLAVNPTDASVVPLLARLSFPTMHLLRLSRLERDTCTETILKYYRQHVPGFPELRSFAVLREIFV